MTPANRRVRRPEPPPDVLEVAAERSEAPVDDAPTPQAEPSAVASRLAPLARDAVGLLMVVGASVAVAWAAERYVSTSPRFNVSDVAVTGNHFRTTEALVERAGLHTGDNVFSIDLEAAETRLEKDPWIEHAALARRLPDHVTLTVKEREAAAIVSIDGEAWLATREGALFKRLEPADPSDFPVITGLRADDVESDRVGASRTIVRALDLVAEYERAPLSQKLPLEEVHMDKARGASLVVGRGAAELVLGAAPYRRKIDQAARVVAELERKGARVDTLFLDNEARPERVVARVK